MIKRVSIKHITYRGLSALFISSAAPAYADEVPRTHASPQTLSMLGDIADQFPAWANGKDIYVITQQDAGGGAIDSNSLQAAIQNIAGNKLNETLDKRPDILKDMRMFLSYEKSAAAVVVNAQNSCIILSNITDRNSVTAHMYGVSGIPEEWFEYIPGTLDDWTRIIYQHEAGHCAEETDFPVEAEYGEHLKREINADRHIFSVNSTSLPQDYILLGAIRMIHHPFLERDHHTAASIDLPGEPVIASNFNAQTVISEFNSILRPLLVKAAATITDEKIWTGALRDTLRTSLIDNELENNKLLEQYAQKNPRYGIEKGVRDFAVSIIDPVEDKIKTHSALDILKDYADQSAFIEEVSFRAGAMLATQFENREIFSLFAKLSEERLAEIPTDSYEAVLLSRYNRALKTFFPETMQKGTIKSARGFELTR